MKKIFLSLLTIFMVLSLSVVFVKANEFTIVSLEEGVQIRTDGNNGLRWVANVTNHKEGNEYGFLFAQGDLAEVTVETTEVEKRVVEGVTEEEPIMSATMVNFPKKAATQDISVVAYVKEGESYSYSNVVVRNLSEVAINAYEKGIATGDFIEAVYDASETTFNLNGGELCSQTMIITRYNNTTSSWGDMANITTKASGLETKNYNRVLLKFDSELNLYKVVGVIAPGTTTSSFASVDYDYRLQGHGTPSNATEKASAAAIAALVGDPTATDYYLSFTLPSSSSNSCHIEVKYSKDVELLTSNKLHIGGGETLPLVQKDYYDFAGWYNNAELTGSDISKQGIDRNLYAKYTPTNYSINYELGDGKWATGFSAPVTYNYESAEIVLPTKENIVIEDGTFVGWYDNPEGTGTAITSIPVNSNGNKSLYAIYQMNKPIEVVLSELEKTTITDYNPTKYVSASFANGKFDINGNVYLAGEGVLYTTLDAALSAASDNDVIYVFAGSYTLKTNLSKKVTILGPNTNLDVNMERSNEAIITVTPGITISSTFVEFNGLTINGSGATATGNYFLTSSTAEVVNVKSSILSKMKTGFYFTAGNGIKLLIEDCNISQFGQFITWVTTGMESTTLISNKIDATSCGATTNPAAALFRTRNGNIIAYDNYFYGDSANEPGFFEVTGGGSGIVKYNTFEKVSKYNYASKTNSITYDENLYIDSTGTVLAAPPANVSAGSAAADVTVCSSEEERAQKYAEFSGEVIIKDYYITYYAAPFNQKTLNFNNGGYYTTNTTSISYYTKEDSKADGWTYAAKIGLTKDENGLFIVKQFIASGTALNDDNRNSDYYIIASSNYSDGYDYLRALTIGDYLEFSTDLSTVATADVVVKQYSENPVTKVTVHDANTTLMIPAALGNTFVGWYKTVDFSGTALTEYTFTENNESITLYSKWEKAYYGVAVKSSVSGYESLETLSISVDGLTITFDGTTSYISFQIYNGVEKMTMSPSKWTFTSDNTSVIAQFSNYSALAKVVGEGTATLTFTNVADPSIVVSITLTVVVSSAE